MPDTYIGRLAPSPTGLLHLGHAATFWTAFTRARERNGTLLLRNEDLDPQRSRAEYVQAMLEDLAWLGIAWDPPMLSQSQRLPAYRAAFERLLATGLVYPCTCSRRELARIAQAPHEDPAAEPDDEPVYDNRCRPVHPTPVANFAPATNYRFRVADGETVSFLDRNLGPQSYIAGRDFGDFLIWRKPDGLHLPALPSYQLACVVETPTPALPRGSAAPTCSNPPRGKSCSSAPSTFCRSTTSTPTCCAMPTASASPSGTTPSRSAPSASEA